MEKKSKKNFNREASSLLKLDELKNLARHVKAQRKNKRELLQSLRKSSQQQAGLGWKGVKRSDTEESVKSEVSAASESSKTTARIETLISCRRPWQPQETALD